VGLLGLAQHIEYCAACAVILSIIRANQPAATKSPVLAISSLEAAIAAYREALKERTRERVPVDWAMTQNNLGIALLRLSGRENSTARLEEAVAVYREALKEWTRERVPLHWAMTQNNLGIALLRLGERENSVARLEEAVAAYHEALKERTRERVPLHWAATQNYLGNTLASLGTRESDTARLEEAIAAYKAALTVLEPANADGIAKRNLAWVEGFLKNRRAQSGPKTQIPK
jgi:tetratricopeptide (TPR) repeat protein